MGPISGERLPWTLAGSPRSAVSPAGSFCWKWRYPNQALRPSCDVIMMKMESAFQRTSAYFASNTRHRAFLLFAQDILNGLVGRDIPIVHTKARSIHFSPSVRTRLVTASEATVPMARLPSGESTFVEMRISLKKIVAVQCSGLCKSRVEKRCPGPGRRSLDSGSIGPRHKEPPKSYRSRDRDRSGRAIPDSSSFSGRGVALLVGSSLILARLASSGFSSKRNSLLKPTVPETGIRC